MHTSETARQGFATANREKLVELGAVARARDSSRERLHQSDGGHRQVGGQRWQGSGWGRRRLRDCQPVTLQPGRPQPGSTGEILNRFLYTKDCLYLVKLTSCQRWSIAESVKAGLLLPEGLEIGMPLYVRNAFPCHACLLAV